MLSFSRCELTILTKLFAKVVLRLHGLCGGYRRVGSVWWRLGVLGRVVARTVVARLLVGRLLRLVGVVVQVGGRRRRGLWVERRSRGVPQRHFTRDFSMPFPISRIALLGFETHAGKVRGFPITTNVVLETCGETCIEVVTKSCITPVKKSRKLVEFYQVHCDSLVVLHFQLRQVSFSVSCRVEGAEVELELFYELRVVVEPRRFTVGEICHVRLKPTLRKTSKIRQRIDHLVLICLKILGTIYKVEVALHKEGTQLGRVSTMEGVGFPCFRTRRGPHRRQRRSVITLNNRSEARKCSCKIVVEVRRW
jgi:hypothetical protein